MALPLSLRQQATWLYDLGMCQLEGGMPEAAAESFSKALTFSPDIGVRPIVAYYLEKIGKPVPPPSKRDVTAAKASTSPELPSTGGILAPFAPGPPLVPGSPATANPNAAPGGTPEAEIREGDPTVGRPRPRGRGGRRSRA